MEFDQLREHQHKAIYGLRQDWKKYRSHLINAPCGFGKTAVAAYLCNSFAKAGLKTVFAAPYVTLVDQTYEKFIEYGMDAPSVIWQRDPRYSPSAMIHIASADTLIARDEAIPEGTRVFIWDECDLRRVRLLEELKNRPEIKVIGLTATPYAPWLGQHYENFIKPCTTNELIDNGWLTPFHIKHPNLGESIERMSHVKERVTGGEKDYAIGEAAEAMMGVKIVGDILGIWMESGENRPTIGFAINKDSANAYTREFLKAGVSAAVIVDNTPKEERERVYKDFRAGIVKVIWNVGVLGAGFDADVRCIIWARPTKSERVWVQGVLRGSRPAKGKTECLLFDHTPTHFNLGDPNDIEYYQLHDGSDGMEQAITKEKEKRKKEAQAKICIKCDRMKASGEYVCVGCGFKPLGGDAAECNESIGLVDAKKSEKNEKFTLEDKQKFYSELQGWKLQSSSSKKPVSDKRVLAMYKNKFGVWPRKLSPAPIAPSVETLNYIKSRQIAYAKSKGAK